jgi:hypothetical protein
MSNFDLIMDKQDYADEKVTSTYEFINFVDSKAQFLHLCTFKTPTF